MVRLAEGVEPAAHVIYGCAHRRSPGEAGPTSPIATVTPPSQFEFVLVSFPTFRTFLAIAKSWRILPHSAVFAHQIVSAWTSSCFARRRQTCMEHSIIASAAGESQRSPMQPLLTPSLSQIKRGKVTTSPSHRGVTEKSHQMLESHIREGETMTQHVSSVLIHIPQRGRNIARGNGFERQE